MPQAVLGDVVRGWSSKFQRGCLVSPGEWAAAAFLFSPGCQMRVDPGGTQQRSAPKLGSTLQLRFDSRWASRDMKSWANSLA